MSFTIIRAFADGDFRLQMLERIREKFLADPQARFFYIVPNHLKFSAEVDVLKRFGQMLGRSDDSIQAFSRLQVYSLSRLFWALTKNRDTRPEISNQALSILTGQFLRKVPVEQLGIFARSATRPGFIADLSAQLLEIWSSGLNTDLLLASHQNNDRLLEKLKLLHSVEVNVLPQLKDYQLYNERLNSFSQQLERLDLDHFNFYLEGFSGFTAAELSIVKKLILLNKEGKMGTDSEIVISLLGDAKQFSSQEGSLFYKPDQLIKKEFTHAQIISADRQRPLCRSQKNFEALWRNLENGGTISKKVSLDKMRFVVSGNQEQEVNFIARDIRCRLKNDPDLRAGDILVLAQRLGSYKEVIPHFFDRYQLPYYLDADVKMNDHPLSLLLENLFRPVREFDYDRLMKIFKSGLFQWDDQDDFLQALDYFENYLLAVAPNEEQWRQGPFKQPAPYDQDQISEDLIKTDRLLEKMRTYILTVLDDFKKTFHDLKNYQQAVSALYDFLLRYHLDQRIIEQAKQGDDRGQQIWKLFISSLEEINRLIGQESFDADNFSQIFKDVFSASSFTGIPAGMDQITISESGIVQRNDFKLLYFINASDQNLPAQISTSSLLDDQDRQQLADEFNKNKQDYYLQDTSRQQMAAENLSFYSSVMSSVDAVVFTMPQLRLDGRHNSPSLYLDRLMLPEVSDLKETKNPELPKSSDQLIDYLGTPASSLSLVNRMIRTFGFRSVNDLAALLEKKMPDFKRIFTSKDYVNHVDEVRPDLVEKIFGHDLKLSISQVEKYFSNPYEYFLIYGLRLKKRERFLVDPALAGSYYHSIFQKTVNDLIISKRNFAQIDEQELAGLIKRSADSLKKDDRFKILDSDDHYRALDKSLIDDTYDSLNLIKQANQYNQSKPLRTEAPFGKVKQDDQQTQPPLAGLVFDLDEDRKLYLRGKIDRIDQQDPEKQFYTIIDYKSSGKKFNLRDVFAGTELQLLTYWLALANDLNAKNISTALPAGAVFAAIKQPSVSLADAIKSGIDSKNIVGNQARRQDPDFRFNGILLDRPEYLENLQNVEEGQSARFYNFYRKKNGDFGSRSGSLISQDHLAVLLKYDRKKLIEAGKLISRGRFPLKPVRNGNRSALTFSDYQQVMNFDLKLGNEYNDLDNIPSKGEELYKMMREEQR